ncbi:hypothetical protein BH11VER1_BH11VER1_40790 [soil metagenome]
MNSKHSVFLHCLVVFFSALIASFSHAQTAPDKAVVKGKFLGDGKDGKIQYLVVQTRESFSDKAAIKLVFTEKNPSASKKPDFDAAFKELGSALILSVFKDGGIFGCEVAHTSHEKSPFTALGEIKITDFTVTDTQVSGHVITPGELEAFGQRWEVDLTFSAPLPKGAFAAVSEPAPEAKKMEKDTPEEPVATGPQMPVGELPLPTAALEVAYNQTVEHIAFRSDSSVSTVANDFSAKLKKQGWKEGPGGLMSKASAILKRTRNGAELTIMVQPAGKGCTVKVFTEGLDWSVVPTAPPVSSPSSTPDSTTTKPATKPAKSSDADDGEGEAKRLLKDAMKKLPKGF